MRSNHHRPLSHVVARTVAVVLIAATPGMVAGQQPGGGAPPPCTADEHRQFDFWAGTWDVRDGDGVVLGTNRITPILGGCVLFEEWTAAGGSSGKSFNLYDRSRGRWHQTWVDGNGLLLELDGGLRDGAMVLEGTTIGRDGKEASNRITWAPLDDGRVRQRWEVSRDGGSTWTTLFDGYYSRTEGR